MLVLSRFPGEAVIIGQPPYEIRIVVTTIRDGKVKLAFDAPEHVLIDREEIRLARLACPSAGEPDGDPFLPPPAQGAQ